VPIIKTNRKSNLGLAVSLSFHALLFGALLSIGNGQQEPIQSPQVIEVATLLLQQPPAKLELPAAAHNPASVSPPAVERVKTPPQPVIKSKEKPKPKPKNKPREQPVVGNDNPVVEPADTVGSLSASNETGTSVGAGSGGGKAGNAGSGPSGDGQYVPADYSSAALRNPPTYYPPMAVQRGLQGTVKLRIQVLADGRAAEIQIKESSGHEVLDRAALEQVREWRFLPARRGDQAITSWVVVPIKFRIERERR
jgi:protein TonB